MALAISIVQTTQSMSSFLSLKKTGRKIICGQRLLGNQLDIEFHSWTEGGDGKCVTMIKQKEEFRINLEVNKESGLNLFKHKVYCCCYHFDLLLSTNALPLTNHGLELLK